MTDAPRRPGLAPAEGGAAPIFDLPRLPNGQFANRDAAAPSITRPTRKAVSADPPVASKRRATPEQLVTRVTRAIERELAQIEDIVGGGRVSASKRTDGEKRARTLASLARTLAEMTRLRDAHHEAKPDHDNDAVPRDLDEFRQTLERRLAQMVDPPEGASDRGDDPA